MLNMASLLLISIPLGFLGSLTGLGGASILVPILVTLGIPVKEAIASGMVTVIAPSSGSAPSFAFSKGEGGSEGEAWVKRTISEIVFLSKNAL